MSSLPAKRTAYSSKDDLILKQWVTLALQEKVPVVLGVFEDLYMFVRGRSLDLDGYH